MKPKRRTIVIADDQNIFAEGTKQLLENKMNVAVVQIVKKGNLVKNALQKLNPDVLLLDLNMPDKTGFEVLEEIRSDFKNLIIIILTTYKSNEMIQKAKKLGANAFLSKDVSTNELENVIFRAPQNDFYVSMPKNSKEQEFGNDKFKGIVQLTKREKEIIKLLSEGYSSKDISSKLSISINTVQTHRKNLFKKLNTSKVSELIKIANDYNLL